MTSRPVTQRIGQSPQPASAAIGEEGKRGFPRRTCTSGAERGLSTNAAVASGRVVRRGGRRGHKCGDDRQSYCFRAIRTQPSYLDPGTRRGRADDFGDKAERCGLSVYRSRDRRNIRLALRSRRAWLSSPRAQACNVSRWISLNGTLPAAFVAGHAAHESGGTAGTTWDGSTAILAVASFGARRLVELEHVALEVGHGVARSTPALPCRRPIAAGSRRGRSLVVSCDVVDADYEELCYPTELAGTANAVHAGLIDHHLGVAESEV